MLNTIKDFSQIFFNNLNIKIDSLEIEEEKIGIFLIKIQSEESGLLIWPHWKNLDAIQNLLRLLISKRNNSKVKIDLEINDYRQAKDDKLFQFIKTKIEEVKNTGKDIMLPYYSAYDRKKIHSFVSEHNDDSLFTKSIGEDKERRLYICKPGAKLSIDIDWDDI